MNDSCAAKEKAEHEEVARAEREELKKVEPELEEILKGLKVVRGLEEIEEHSDKKDELLGD